MRQLFTICGLFIFLFSHAQSWTTLSVGSTADVMAISFPSEDTGFASLGNGTMRKTFDGGTTWLPVNLTGPYSGRLQFLSASKGFILDSGIAVTNNGGVSWSVCFNNLNVVWTDIFFYDQNIGYACGLGQTYDSVYVYKTIDGGASWNLQSLYPDMGAVLPWIYFRTTTEGYMTGSDQLRRTNDGGTTWTSVYTPPGSDPIGTVYAPDAVNAYCATQIASDIAKSVNGGLSWNSTSQMLSGIPYGSYFFNSTTGFICGGTGLGSGYIVKTTDGGTSWTTDYPTSQTMLCMDFPSSAVGYCGGTGGLIVKYSGPLSAQENTSTRLSCYPNPATDAIVLENVSPGSLITITDPLGQTVQSLQAYEVKIMLDLTSLQSGVYYVSVADQRKLTTIPFVKD